MEKMKNMPASDAAVIGTVRGIAFSVIAAAYLLIGGQLGNYLWCVYLGFLLTVALGTEGTRWVNYLFSLMAGYFYAYVFFGIKNALLLFFENFPAVVISEFLITFIILFTHLAVLRKTRLNTIPMIFAGVTSVFASGGLNKIPLCFASIVIGILTAVLTDVIVKKISKIRKKSK